MEDLSVVHEHVDLVYGTYALNVELLEGGLELLVIGGTGLLGSDLPPDRSLGTACVRAECECRLPLSFEIVVVPLWAALCCPRPEEPGEVRGGEGSSQEGAGERLTELELGGLGLESLELVCVKVRHHVRV